jgi:glycosyltransferase involved in cell wall biosynthesis
LVLPRQVYGSLFDLKDSVPQRVPISVVIPLYNEVNAVQTVIERILATGFDVDVIVVDDASTEGTREFLQSYSHLRVKTIFHRQNAGKGAALRSGFALATNPYVLIQDADLEYDPRDFAAMLAPLADGHTDMEYGLRFFGWIPSSAVFLAFCSQPPSDVGCQNDNRP